MAYYGSQTQAAMPPTQLQNHMRMQQMHQLHMNIARPMMANAAANNGRAGLPQNQHGGGTAAAAAPNNDEEKTLELQQITQRLDPSGVSKHAPTLYPTLVQLFTKLPKEEAALLVIAECFTFVYRKRGPHEPSVMPNAKLYFTRLNSISSPLCSQLDTSIGFRCCGCSHTTHNPNNYTVGAAQLLNSQYVKPQALRETVAELKKHYLICPSVTKEIKQSIARTSVRNSEHSSLEEYLEVWIKALSMAKGIPALAAIHVNANSNQPRPLTNAADSRILPEAARREALANQKARAHALGHTGTSQRGTVAPTKAATAVAARPPIQLQAAISNTEDEIYADLEHSILQSLVENNFGLANFKPIILVSDLSELPIAPDMMVSPLLEVLFQSFCVVQRWTPARAAGKKRTSEEMDVPARQIRRPQIFFECVHCKDPSHSFCATTGSAWEAAEFVCASGCKHLSEDCRKTPSAISRKVSNMNSRVGTDQMNEQTKLVEASFLLWQQQLVHQGKKKGKSTSKLATKIRFWKPLTWDLLKETAGAAVRAEKLECADASVALLGKADKKLPYATKEHDVLVGWNGPHLGNRRFIRLLNETRELFNDEELSPAQEKLVADKLVNMVDRRGGNFYFVARNYVMPSTEVTREKAVFLTLRAFKHGAMVILKPPSPDVEGKGSCVLETEYVPQQDVFTKEIVRNKRYKRVAVEEEEKE